MVRPSWLSKPASCVLIAGLVSIIGICRPLQAQDSGEKKPASEPAATIAVDVNVVTLPVTVRDKHDKIIRDLTKDDFTLQEDGRPQAIKYFSQDTNLPLTLGLLVDTSRSQTNVLDAERNASRSFLEQMLVQEKDRAFLIHFDREVELLQDLTSSREKLQKALDLLKSSDDRERSNDPNDPSNSPSGSGSHHGGGTQLYDAVYLASNELMKKQQGRKALIILSDGVDRGSKTYLEGAIEAAQRSDTVVYSIYFAEPHREEGEGTAEGWGVAAVVGLGAVAVGPGAEEVDIPVAVGVGAAASGVPKNRASMERRFWNGFPKKPAVVSLKFPRNRRWARSTTALSKNCERSTTWVLRPTKKVRPRDITTFN